jgi:hypothetical protein
MKSLTEEQILDLVDGDHLSMGSHGSIDKSDRSGERGRDNSDRGNDGGGGGRGRDNSDKGVDQTNQSDATDIVGDSWDVYSNNIIFVEG